MSNNRLSFNICNSVYTHDDSHESDLIMTNCCEILNLDISKSGKTNEDDSYVNDLNLDRDRGVDAAIQCDTFKNDSEVAPPSCTIFSDDGGDVDGPRFLLLFPLLALVIALQFIYRM
jgi:hypothetical protein